MAFKKTQPIASVPDSPEKILLDLSRRKIPGVLLHQGEMLKAYATKAADAINTPDVAIQLPTGSGKTLVGLLIAEWRRRKNKERIVYLCPTNQLVNQVVEQANFQYGLTVHGFTGPFAGYEQEAKAAYQNADSIAVSSYSALFNTKPYFANAQVIIIDDAHAAENYISKLWTVKIDRTEIKHQALHTAITNLIKPFLGNGNWARIKGNISSMADLTWVDKLPTPYLLSIHDELQNIVDTHAKGLDINYSWSMIRGQLMACHVYLTHSEILIRPLIPPTWSHEAFNNAEQRIFMSATLGLGGDLERLTGRKNIKRLPIPEGWDKQGIGRRFFMFPSLSLKEDEASDLAYKLMKQAGRSVVLVPTHKEADEITKEIKKKLDYQVFNSEDIEESKRPFISVLNAVAVIAGRYDGIDFPGKDCRLLFVDGLPKATNAQERFLMSRMAANVLFNDRIQTRVLQAIGRCTRSLEDYSAVVIYGEDLSNYLADVKRRQYLHPELQAEIEFGLNQSKGVTKKDFQENLKTFLDHDKEWEDTGNQEIVSIRNASTQRSFPAIEALSKAVKDEIKYQQSMWQGDYESAMASAENVLAQLEASELIGYRALWHYLAGSAAQLAKIRSKDKPHFERAKKAAPAISWLVGLSRYQNEPEEKPNLENEMLIMQLERVESQLESLGLIHPRQYNEKEKAILEGLQDENKFEAAHVLLGEMLGFQAGKEESDGSPDPWWHIGKICFVFEDNAGAKNQVLETSKARQAATHDDWIREKGFLDKDASIYSILITPKTKAALGAVPHLKNFLLWDLDDFRAWAEKALTVLRGLRTTFSESGDLEWRAKAAEQFKTNNLDASSLLNMLKPNVASKMLKK
jgi:hypothetical protein